MEPETVNKLKDNEIGGDFIGHDKITVNITMFQDSEREFVVTHNANIKPVSYFTGREAELQDLRQRIEDGRKSVLVSGMGGIGKTHICRKLFEEYLKRHAEDENVPFQHLGFIAYDGDMDSSLQNCLKFKKQDNPEKNQEAAWQELEYLASGGKLLLFVDNVDKPISADLGLQRLKGIPGAVVLTSRRRAFSKEFEPYRIGFLSTDKCREIYEKIRYEDSDTRVAEKEVPDLEYVIDTLAARHTITIEFLAHLARTNNWTVKELREELEKNGFQLEYIDDEDKLVNIQKSYETLYDMSVLTEAEQNILEAFSIFPYIPLKSKICDQWLLADAGVGEEDYVLMKLFRKGWLQFDAEQEDYSLHPVFAQFIYEKCRPVMEKHTGLIEACQRNLKIPESGSVLECRLFIPFAENIIEKLCVGNNLEQVSFISTIAYLLYHVAEYKKAEALYKKILRISESVLGEEHADTAALFNNLAYMYATQGEYKKAEKLYEKSMRIRERVLGEEHSDTAMSYNNLAGVYKSQGEYKKAERLYEKSLRISERVLGEEHPDTAASYNNLAGVYESQGEYNKAEELYEKSLRIRERVLGGEHPDTAASYNNLAYVYERKGEYKKAERLYEKSLRISERVLGKEHPDTAMVYNNLAGVHKSQGEYKKAEELYEKSLRIMERVLGEEHPDTATSYNNLAGVYKAQGKYTEAKELYEKSLQLSERVLGKEHPDIAVNYNNLAGIYETQGKYMEAEELYKKSIQIWKRAFGEEHLSIAVGYNNLATVYEMQEKYIEAEELCGKSLRIRERLLGEEHPDTVLSYENLAVIYGNQGKYMEAEKLFKKSLLIRIKVQGEGHPDTAISYSNLAKIYYCIKEYERALDCIFKAYKTFRMSFGEEDFRTKNCRTNMEAIYFSYKQEGDFKQWVEEKMKE